MPSRDNPALEASHLLQAPVGLDAILWQEVRERDPDVQRVGSLVLPDKNSLLLVSSDEYPQLLRCRVAEDVFRVLSRTPAGIDAAALDAIVDAAAESPHMDDALREHADVTGGRGKHATSTFRVVVRAAGDRGYRRIDVEKRMTVAIGERLGKKWRAVDDAAQVEVWVTLTANQAITALRLSDASMRHGGLTVHREGGLRPAVAAAMVRLSMPQDDDIVVDPFCGSGTILIERDLAGRHGQLLGGDFDPAAVEAATRNVGPRHKPIDLKVWDAVSLPLRDESADVVMTNPPFGIKVGEKRGLSGLYRAFLAEAYRVLRPGGRLVVLAHDPALVDASLAAGSWAQQRRVDLITQGRAATIGVFYRLGG